ncbi:MAG: hypothetical protein EOM87_10460, partial [Clostridia bacterium]|nr:hypothetical protein [Clostridia bacterium]
CSDAALASPYTFGTMPKTNIKLYAKWEPIEYTVSFEKQGASDGANSVTAVFGIAMTATTPPTRPNYVFDGYYAEQNGEGIKYYNDDMTSANDWDLLADTTLYANWINTYVITYHSNDGSSVNAQTVIKNMTFELPAIPVKNGYYFGGWFLDNNTFNNQLSTAGIQANVNVFAKWIPYWGTPSFNGNLITETGINQFSFSFPSTDDYDHSLLTFAISNESYDFLISQSPDFVEGEAMVIIFIYNEQDEEIGTVEISIMAIE